MQNIRKFTVVPSLPDRLARLKDIAYNLWWVWEPEAIPLWTRMDIDLWEEVYHNPVKLLGAISQNRLKELSEDDSFLAHVDRVAEKLDAYMEASTWFDARYDNRDKRTIAYFSFEYGLTESLPIYSGGLGVLSGDHLKSASELGLPLVGIGMMYYRGYFRQYLNADGWQQEFLPNVDFYTLPVVMQKDHEGKAITVEVKIGGRTVQAHIWKVQVGRIPLYLLDAHLPENHPDDREITAQLYSAEPDMRIRQEKFLGIGGPRALKALGINPSTFHMNEGHAAFQALERIRDAMQTRGISFDEAKILTTAGNVFTTHTPVPAGNDRFEVTQMEHFFSEYYTELGLSWEKFLGLGREDETNHAEPFCMTVLALKLSAHANGVSQLHGHTSRDMWKNIWPAAPIDEIPIHSITNGIHIRSWLSGELATLFDRYLGVRWWKDPVDLAVWERVNRIPDAELWRAHQRQSEHLVTFARRRLAEQLTRRGLPAAEIREAAEVLDPESLTIGFSRRFVAYKRGTMLFTDPSRLSKILNDPDRPVQLIFAGKAHPADNKGKELIRQIAHFARQPEFRHRLVFLEDYDINVARELVQGVDVWLNTPRRPLEASGTSGMKAAANGILNLSILDGWWCEAFNGENGWAIGSGEIYEDTDYQDRIESQALYEILEKDVVPLFYERGRDALPREWIGKMKNSLISCCPRFNTNRMLREYSERFYFPSSDQTLKLLADDSRLVHDIAEWEKRVLGKWDKVKLSTVHTDDLNHAVSVGQQLPIRVEVALGEINPEDIDVEVYYGSLDSAGEIQDGKVLRLESTHTNANGQTEFTGSIPCHTSGRIGFVPRVIAHHPEIPVQDRLKNIIWG